MADETREVLVKVTLDDRQYQSEIAKQTDATEKNTKSQDENTEAKSEGEEVTEDYSAATGALTGQIDKMTGGMASATKGIFAQIKSFKSLKVAIAASGIGLIVLAFAAIWTAVQRLEGPMQKFAEVMKGIEGVTGVVLDTFGKLGVALVQLFSGKGAKAAETYKDALEGVTDEMQNMFDLGVLIAKQQKESSVNESARNAVIAKNNRAIERELLISRDIGKSIDERQEAIARANELQLENVTSAGKTARERLQIAKNEFELSSKNSNDVITFNQALTDFQNSQLQREIRLRDLENRRVDLQRQSIALEKKADADALLAANARATEWALEQTRMEESQAFIDSLIVAVDEVGRDGIMHRLLYGDAETREKEAKRQEEISTNLEAFFATQELQEEKADTVSEDSHKAALARGKITNEARVQAKNEAIAGAVEVASLVASLGADGAKAQAIFQGAAAIANAWQGFIVTLADPLVPFWGKFAAGAAVLTAGLNAAVKVKTAYAAGTPEMAHGGWLSGPSHAGGGIDINAEGGEFMVNKRSMANPTLSRMVEKINDFGNRQVMALGGFVGGQAGQLSAIRALPDSIGATVNQVQTVLVTEDLDVVQNRVAVTEDRSILTP